MHPLRALADKIIGGATPDQNEFRDLLENSGAWRDMPSDTQERLATRLREHAAGLEPQQARGLAGKLADQIRRGHAGPKLVEALASLPNFVDPLRESTCGVLAILFGGASTSPEKIRQIRDHAATFGVRGVAGLVRIDPAGDLKLVENSVRRAVGAIDGFGFLSRAPAEATENCHTVLIKPGVNWGKRGCPAVASWESVYAVTKMLFAEADARGAQINRVIIGDESGVENKIWGDSSLKNMEDCSILHAGVLVGLERAATLQFPGAPDLLERARTLDRVRLEDTDLIAMAGKAGVELMGFENGLFRRFPVKHARYFTEGVMMPTVLSEVTDIVNVPKPPGRHMVLGPSGVSGAVKNHIGLLAASDRTPALHGPFDRLPRIENDERPDTYRGRLELIAQKIHDGKTVEVAEEFAHSTKFNWDAAGPTQDFHEKLTELYIAVMDKERFSVTDMRRTFSSIGPSFGDICNIGAVIASPDPTTLDLVAAALLKMAYVNSRSSDAGEPSRVTEYLSGRTWIPSNNAFDLPAHLAANSYCIGPVDRAHLDFPGLEQSGYTQAEMERLFQYLG
jgi:uncharacterized protein (DUF362 family)